MWQVCNHSYKSLAISNEAAEETAESPATSRVYFDPQQRTSLRLYYGDEKLLAPIYDYARFLHVEPSAGQAQLGPGAHNDQYVGRPDERPWMGRGLERCAHDADRALDSNGVEGRDLAPAARDLVTAWRLHARGWVRMGGGHLYTSVRPGRDARRVRVLRHRASRPPRPLSQAGPLR